MMSLVYPSRTAPTFSWRPRAVARYRPQSSKRISGSAGRSSGSSLCPIPPAGLLFKGGTSLSKVFGVIERFSEDVDLSFDRAGLGFGGESDPLNAITGKKRKHGLEALTETCQRATEEQASASTRGRFRRCLG